MFLETTAIIAACSAASSAYAAYMSAKFRTSAIQASKTANTKAEVSQSCAVAAGKTCTDTALIFAKVLVKENHISEKTTAATTAMADLVTSAKIVVEKLTEDAKKSMDIATRALVEDVQRGVEAASAKADVSAFNASATAEHVAKAAEYASTTLSNVLAEENKIAEGHEAAVAAITSLTELANNYVRQAEGLVEDARRHAESAHAKADASAANATITADHAAKTAEHVVKTAEHVATAGTLSVAVSNAAQSAAARMQVRAECYSCTRAVNSYTLRPNGQIVCKYCADRGK